jgi:hypothetical protein
MQPLASKFVAMTLAIAFAGAHVCVCLATTPASPKDKHACCRNDSKPKPSEDPCRNCPTKQKIEQIAPERTGHAATVALDFHALPAIMADDAAQEFSRTGALHDTIPPPLILHALFHSGCQLTV